MDEEKIIPDILLEEAVKQTIPKEILVFGCGFDLFPFYIQKKFFENSLVVGYDIDKNKIQSMKKRKKIRESLGLDYNIEFTTKKPTNKFELVLALAVIHENPEEIISEISNLTKPKGYIGLIDYDMKNMAKKDFFSRWGHLLSEIKELEQIGANRAHHIHTQFGLDDCIQTSQKQGFEMIFQKGNLHSLLYSGIQPTKHFVYLGQKE